MDAYQHRGWRVGTACNTLTAGQNDTVRGDTPLVVAAYSFDSLSSNSMKSSNPYSGCRQVDIAKCPDTTDPNPCKNQGGIAVVHAYDIGEARLRNPSEYVELSPTITARCGTGGNNVPATVYALQANGTDRAAYCVGNGQMCNITMAPIANSLDCMHDQQAVLTTVGALCARDYKGVGTQYVDEGKVIIDRKHPHRKYIVRCLTPVECARLQGFPDWWCMGLETPEPTEEDIAWAAEVWEGWRLITSPDTKPKSRNQLVKWLKNPHSDAAEYKLWGNGIALPCAVRVMEGIVKEDARNG